MADKLTCMAVSTLSRVGEPLRVRFPGLAGYFKGGLYGLLPSRLSAKVGFTSNPSTQPPTTQTIGSIEGVRGRRIHKKKIGRWHCVGLLGVGSSVLPLSRLGLTRVGLSGRYRRKEGNRIECLQVIADTFSFRATIFPWTAHLRLNQSTTHRSHCRSPVRRSSAPGPVALAAGRGPEPHIAATATFPSRLRGCWLAVAIASSIATPVIIRNDLRCSSHEEFVHWNFGDFFRQYNYACFLRDISIFFGFRGP